MLILPLGMNIPDIRLYELMCTRAQRDLVASKNQVTRLLSTREKSIKIEHLTWYLQCFVCIIIPGPELQKYAKLAFHPEQLGFLVFLVMSVDELVYVFPQTGINDFVISVFQGMWHDFFQPHPRPI